MKIADQLPRVFQANADRFYRRVILETLDRLPMHASLEIGEAYSISEFAERAAAQVENYTANEAAKAFALTLDGLFERQLGRWLMAHDRRAADWEQSLNIGAEIGLVDLTGTQMKAAFLELHSLANVVRHGDGPACNKLKGASPHLWDDAASNFHDLAPGDPPASDSLRVRPIDLQLYARTIVRFWGHVDPLPGAVLDPPW